MTGDRPGPSERSRDEFDRVSSTPGPGPSGTGDLSRQERELFESLEQRIEQPDVGADDAPKVASAAGHEEEDEAVEPVSSEPEADEDPGSASSDHETTEEAVEPLHRAVEDEEETADEEPARDEKAEEAETSETDDEEDPMDESEQATETEDGETTDTLGQQAEQALEAAQARREEPGYASASDGGSVLDVLSPFTVVAPPQGSIQGDWVVEGHEAEGLGDELGLEDDEDLAAPWPGEEEAEEEGVPEWPEEEEEEEPLEEDEFEDWPDEELDEAEEDLVEAEAEPEQTDEEAWEEEDEEFWEDLLEDEEPEEEPAAEDEDEAPVFEDAGDWLEEEEPATEGDRAREERDAWIEESFEQPEPEADEDEVEFTLSEEPEEEDEVEFTLSEGDDNPSSQSGGAEAMTASEADTADENPHAEDDDVYTHGPYTLYQKTVQGSEGETEDLFFFARNPPEDAEPSELPDGHEVGVNERTGVPFVRESGEDE